MEALHLNQALDDAPTGSGALDCPFQSGLIPGLVNAFRIHDDGTADPLPIDQPIERRQDGWLWLHLDLADVRAIEWLAAADELPVQAVKTLLSRDRHQQLHATESCIWGIIADFKHALDGVADDIGHLRFIMTDRLLISGRHHALASIDATRIAIENGTCRLTHVASLLELIVEQIADGIDEIADGLASDLDTMEDILAARTGGFDRQRLVRVRGTSVRLHRQISGLRAVFHRFERQGTESIKPALRLQASKLAQRLDDLDHSVVEIRERGHRIQEEFSSMMTEGINRNLYILSILTALLMPATLMTGIFGMNVKGMPLTESDSDFVWAIGLMVCLSIAVYLFIRRIGMFRF